jgi:pSer/pThr/pTyr-binding forkhead associated (FHA) protein
MAELAINLTPFENQIFILPSECSFEVRIGRDESNDIIISNTHVSRRHARITREGDKYLITDRDSMTGTAVNGHFVRQHELSDGDQISFGPVTAAFIAFNMAYKHVRFISFACVAFLAVSHDSKLCFAQETKPVSSSGTGSQAQALAIQKFPEIGIAGSEANKRFLTAVEEARKTRPNLFKSNDWPLQIALENESHRSLTKALSYNDSKRIAKEAVEFKSTDKNIEAEINGLGLRLREASSELAQLQGSWPSVASKVTTLRKNAQTNEEFVPFDRSDTSYKQRAEGQRKKAEELLSEFKDGAKRLKDDEERLIGKISQASRTAGDVEERNQRRLRDLEVAKLEAAREQEMSSRTPPSTAALQQELKQDLDETIFQRNRYSPIASSQYGVSVIKKDGTLWACGMGKCVGDGMDTEKFRGPVRLSDKDDWISVSGGLAHRVALKRDGTVWAWGANSVGSLGDGSFTDRLAPVRVGTDTDWRFVNCVGFFTVAIKTNGSLWAWGPVGDILENHTGTDAKVNRPVRIGTESEWKMASIQKGMIIALRTDGTLFIWGAGASESSGKEVKASTPIQIGPERSWAMIPQGTLADFAIKKDGTLWRLNLGSHEHETRSPSPNQVGSRAGWVSFTGDRFFHSGVQLDGSLWAWGGDEKAPPVRVVGTGWNFASSYMNFAKNFQSKFDVVEGEVFAIKQDGTLWAWNHNSSNEVSRPAILFKGNDWGLQENLTLPSLMASEKPIEKDLLRAPTSALVDSEEDKTHSSATSEEKEFRKLKPWVERHKQKYGYGPETREGYFGLETDAKQGVIEAQFFLGLRLSEVSDHGKDREAASLGMHWLEKAAEREFPLAELYVGLAYVNGLAGEKHAEIGVRWLRKAALHGLETANKELAKVELNGEENIRKENSGKGDAKVGEAHNIDNGSSGSNSPEVKKLMDRGLSLSASQSAMDVIRRHSFSVRDAIEGVDMAEKKRMLGGKSANQILGDPEALNNVLRVMSAARDVFN